MFTTSTFDSKRMNWAALGEFVFAVLTTQMEALRRILGTTDLDMQQFRWALIPAVALRWPVRRSTGVKPSSSQRPLLDLVWTSIGRWG